MRSVRAVVIGIGNRFRRDDGAGSLVVDRLRGPAGLGDVLLVESDGDATRLVDLWDGVHTAVVVDAVRTVEPVPGRVHRIETGRLSGSGRGEASSHSLGLGDAVDLAAILDRLPERLIVFAVEGADFTFGVGLSEPVRPAVESVAYAIERELGGCG